MKAWYHWQNNKGEKKANTHTHSLNSVLLVSLSFSLSLSSLSMLFALMGSMWFRWVCSDVGVVCSDRCIMGQVVDWHGGPWVMGFGFGLIWAFFWVNHVASMFSRYLLGWLVYHGSSSDWCGFDIFLGWSSVFFLVFSGLIMWLWCFLDIFWVDRCIMGQAPIDVASTFFWVDHRRFSGYFRQPGFQIRDVSFWSVAWVVGVVAIVGSRWFVCVWLYWWFGGLCLCVALLIVCVCVCVCVCVWLCVCGDWFA